MGMQDLGTLSEMPSLWIDMQNVPAESWCSE